MIIKNHGLNKNLENRTYRKLSVLSSSLYSFLIRMTGYFEAFELQDTYNNFGSICFHFQSEVISN